MKRPQFLFFYFIVIFVLLVFSAKNEQIMSPISLEPRDTYITADRRISTARCYRQGLVAFPAINQSIPTVHYYSSVAHERESEKVMNLLRLHHLPCERSSPASKCCCINMHTAVSPPLEPKTAVVIFYFLPSYILLLGLIRLID